MPAKTIMVQGTASSVGKSVMVAALCRILRQDGYSVAPFKSQNMALNSFATADGKEMGRAQVVQAYAAGLQPQVEMNPILLKPEGNSRSQVIVMGVPIGSMTARDYYKLKPELWPVIEKALDYLKERYEVIVIEGAGSPAEINLRESDIVNMKVAHLANAPVLLVGDIDRGGVFASLVGTMELLLPEERQSVKGMVINKFRGDLSLLTPGLTFLEERTGVPVLGVVPYYQDIHLPEEDSVALERRKDGGQPAKVIDVAVIRLPHISNFDDFDPFDQADGVTLRYVSDVDRLESPDLIIIPGTKSTMEDLLYIKEKGLATRIKEAAAAGTPVFGICGGYQMLGTRLMDPDHVESIHDEVDGMGLLPVETTFLPNKITQQVAATVEASAGILSGAAGFPVTGYEIHCGISNRDGLAPAFLINQRGGSSAQDYDGAVSGDGTVIGTYIHGLFHNKELFDSLLGSIARRKGVVINSSNGEQQDQYDKLADLVRNSLDMAKLNQIIGLQR
ncbi:MAG: cobyric acid synthase [Dehalococcoidia bacterium]|nr:cobyric acid synthase [Dehalococcoidia bacterium]